MIIRCQCKKQFKISDEKRGMRVKCPTCQAVFIAEPVPATSVGEEATATKLVGERSLPNANASNQVQNPPVDSRNLGPLNDPLATLELPASRQLPGANLSAMPPKPLEAFKNLPWLKTSLAVGGGVVGFLLVVFLLSSGEKPAHPIAINPPPPPVADSTSGPPSQPQRPTPPSPPVPAMSDTGAPLVPSSNQSPTGSVPQAVPAPAAPPIQDPAARFAQLFARHFEPEVAFEEEAERILKVHAPPVGEIKVEDTPLFVEYIGEIPYFEVQGSNRSVHAGLHMPPQFLGAAAKIPDLRLLNLSNSLPPVGWLNQLHASTSLEELHLTLSGATAARRDQVVFVKLQGLASANTPALFERQQKHKLLSRTKLQLTESIRAAEARPRSERELETLNKRLADTVQLLKESETEIAALQAKSDRLKREISEYIRFRNRIDSNDRPISAAEISSLAKIKSLKRLIIVASSLDAETCAALAGLDLDRLEIETVGDCPLAAFEPLTRCQARELKLMVRDYRDTGVFGLLRQMRNLDTLDLSLYLQTSQKLDLNELAFPEIRELTVQTPFSFKGGLEWKGSLPSLPKLRLLRLAGTFSDTSLASISSSPELKAISFTPMQSGGTPRLVASECLTMLAALPNLHPRDIQGNFLPTDIERLAPNFEAWQREILPDDRTARLRLWEQNGKELPRLLSLRPMQPIKLDLANVPLLEGLEMLRSIHSPELDDFKIQAWKNKTAGRLLTGKSMELSSRQLLAAMVERVVKTLPVYVHPKARGKTVSLSSSFNTLEEVLNALTSAAGVEWDTDGNTIYVGESDAVMHFRKVNRDLATKKIIAEGKVVAGLGREIEVEVVDQPLQDAFRMLADTYDLPIYPVMELPDNQLVTFRLQAPLESCLNLICENQGLDWAAIGKVIVVGPPERIANFREMHLNSIGQRFVAGRVAEQLGRHTRMEFLDEPFSSAVVRIAQDHAVAVTLVPNDSYWKARLLTFRCAGIELNTALNLICVTNDLTWELRGPTIEISLKK